MIESRQNLTVIDQLFRECEESIDRIHSLMYADVRSQLMDVPSPCIDSITTEEINMGIKRFQERFALLRAACKYGAR